MTVLPQSRAALRNNDTGTVLREIRRGVEYQS
jgi:hypothetical protein